MINNFIISLCFNNLTSSRIERKLNFDDTINKIYLFIHFKYLFHINKVYFICTVIFFNLLH